MTSNRKRHRTGNPFYEGLSKFLAIGIALALHSMLSRGAPAFSNYGSESIGIAFDSPINTSQSLLASNYQLNGTNPIVSSVVAGPAPGSVILRLKGTLRPLVNYSLIINSNVFDPPAPSSLKLTALSQTTFTSGRTNLPSLPGEPGPIGLFTTKDNVIQASPLPDIPQSDRFALFTQMDHFAYGSQGITVTSLGEACETGLIYTEGFATTDRWLGVFVTRAGATNGGVRIEGRYFDGNSLASWPGSQPSATQYSLPIEIGVTIDLNQFTAGALFGSTNHIRFPTVKPSPWFRAGLSRALVIQGAVGSSLPVTATFSNPGVGFGDVLGGTYYYRTNFPSKGLVFKVVAANYAYTNSLLLRSTSPIPGSFTNSGIPLDLDTFSFFVPIGAEPALFFKVKTP